MSYKNKQNKGSSDKGHQHAGFIENLNIREGKTLRAFIMLKRFILIVAFISCSAIIYAQEGHYEVRSPDDRLVLQLFFESNNGKSDFSYMVSYDGKAVVNKSKLGIWSGNADWTKNMKPGNVKRTSFDNVWEPVYGEKNRIRNHYNRMSVTFHKTENADNELIIETRAYNEGIAFRYIFPEGEHGQYLHITKEETNFVLPEGTLGYFTQRAQTTYELLPVDEFPSECERPLTLMLPNGLYACLAEAEVVNYVRTKFRSSAVHPGTIECSMYGDVNEIEPFETPWRVIMVAESPGQLIENNDLILNLNPPCAIENTGWIKPGKVMREVTLSTKGAKKLVDFAVKRNLQYIHFDAGWYGYEYVSGSDATTVTVDPRRNPKGDLNLQQAISYAKSKGIGVILYVNQRALANQIDSLLPLYRDWGIAGIKFGFVHVGPHRWTVWMHNAVKKCAAYGLMVNVHDEYRPTGFSRTWPNLMTQEGILGNEGFPDANHNTILPFTRFVAGPADYTICYYRQDFENMENSESHGVPRNKTIKTTPAHQLALAVVYYSPLQYMYWYDKPEDSKDEPELAFFDAVPTVWDETKVVQGKIGKYITMARRSGSEWFIGTITNNDGRTLNIPLDFLEPGIQYKAVTFSDGDKSIQTRTKVKLESQTVDRNTVFISKLKPSGGQAIHLVPVKY